MNNFGTAILILALLYILSPVVDVTPDVIPAVGWADDVLVGLGAGIAALGAGRR